MNGYVLDKKGPHWWDTDEGRVWRELIRVGSKLWDQQKQRISDGWRHVRLVAGMKPDMVNAFGSLGFINAAKSGPSRLPRFSFNVIQSVVETATARVASNEILPSYLADGGDWEADDRAEKLTDFVAGTFQATDFAEVATECAEDALILGTGVVKIVEVEGEARAERVFPLELLVDDDDGMYGKPRMLLHRRPVSREVMLATYPKAAAAIRSAPVADTENITNTISDKIMVWEAWHLPSGPDATDGRWVMCVEGGDVFDEEWTKPTFPFEFLRWRRPTLGFWGTGIAEQLTGIQIEINRVVQFAQQSLSAGAFKVFLEVGSRVVKSHISKEMGGIIEYNGAPPQFATPNVLNPQMIDWLVMLYQKAYELTGVSQLSASNQKPAGLNAAVALRAMDDLQDGRFATFGKRTERWHVASAEQIIDLARDIHTRKVAKGERGYVVRVARNDSVLQINWQDVNLKRDQYLAQVFPESALPKSPAARRQSIQEDMQGGLLTPEEGRRLLRYPDLKSTLDLDDAPIDYVRWQISKMLKGEPVTPNPLQDFNLARMMVTKAVQRAEIKGYPEGRLQLLREFLENLDAEQQLAAQAQAPAGPPPGGAPPAPMAKPEAPPTSPLLPNVPGAPPPGMPQ